jgi:hypothetical protein
MFRNHIFNLSGKGSKITHEAKERLLQSRDDVHQPEDSSLMRARLRRIPQLKWRDRVSLVHVESIQSKSRVRPASSCCLETLLDVLEGCRSFVPVMS